MSDKQSYYQMNREYFIKYQREYYKKNREILLPKHKEYNKKYRILNHEKINKYAREMYWIKMGKPVPTEIRKYVKPIPKIVEPVVEIKPLTKLQQKTAAIEEALAELQKKKEAFIAKLAEEKITI